MTEVQQRFKLALEIARQMPPAVFVELHRLENMIRQATKRKPLTEEAYAAGLLSRWRAHG